MNLEPLKNLLNNIQDIEFAILIGSRANGTATPRSDWDIAIRWNKGIERIEALKKAELLKQRVANVLATNPDKIDIVDVADARLAMRAVIAEEGVILKGEGTLSFSHFLIQTWGALEDYYWRQTHAA